VSEPASNPRSEPDWRGRSLGQLLGEHGLDGLPEERLATDGWSGARFSTIERGNGRFVLKRTSPRTDWIARWTRDDRVREACVANRRQTLWRDRIGPFPYLGAAADGDEAAILMPDLSVELIAWERPSHETSVDPAVLERVIDDVARLHAHPWSGLLDPATHRAVGDPGFPWCPLAERLTLTSRPACASHLGSGIEAGARSAERLLAGWDAFDRLAPAGARELVADLSADPIALVAALARLPSVGLHGDLKLANVAVMGGRGPVAFIDWQMTLRAPVAVELGWFLVSNSASLPVSPETVLDGYRESLRWHAGRVSSGPQRSDWATLVGDWDAQVDLTWIVGLLLRGWRKGLDTEAGITLPSGVSATDDLAWWCDRAVEATGRVL
jgi:hypothetical protein